jgi:hypothetical protein
VANSPTAPSNKFLILAEGVAWCGDELMICYRLWWSFLIKLKTRFIYFVITTNFCCHTVNMNTHNDMELQYLLNYRYYTENQPNKWSTLIVYFAFTRHTYCFKIIAYLTIHSTLTS